MLKTNQDWLVMQSVLGEIQHPTVKELPVRLDCDGDAVVLLIEQVGGAACHEGYRSCFSRGLCNGTVSRCSELVFDPKEVYNG